MKISFSLIYLAFLTFAFAETYYAHPKKNLELMELAQANFLLSESLNRISLAYDSLSEVQRKSLLKELLNDDAANEVHQLKNIKDDEVGKLKKLESQVYGWQRNFPRTGLNLGDKGFMTFNTEYILELNHKITRLAYRFAKQDPPQSVTSILNESVFGPNPIYQNDQVKFLNEAANALCGQGSPVLDSNSSLLISFAVKFRARLPDFINAGADQVILGKDKDCNGLTSDVMEIVSPHLGIMRAAPNKPGQLEGLSLFLASKLFSDTQNPLESPLTKLLLKSEQIPSLDKSKKIEEAVADALNLKSTDERLINFFALAGHNHGLETYVMKLSLELVKDPKEAVQTGMRIYRAINHLYGLISTHKEARVAAGAKEILSTSAREYHYWGGALVACELVKRGYKPWISEKVSTTLGSVYEKWTEKSSAEGVASSKEDIHLHEMGARDWISRCR